jgi:hypothetical protein
MILGQYDAIFEGKSVNPGNFAEFGKKNELFRVFYLKKIILNENSVNLDQCS